MSRNAPPSLLSVQRLSCRRAHIGGLVCGFLVGLAYSSGDLPREWQRRFVPIFSVCLLASLFGIAFVDFYLFTTAPASPYCT